MRQRKGIKGASADIAPFLTRSNFVQTAFLLAIARITILCRLLAMVSFLLIHCIVEPIQQFALFLRVACFSHV
jgi:hypothetical protein